MSVISMMSVFVCEAGAGGGGGYSVRCWEGLCHWDAGTGPLPQQQHIPIQVILWEYDPWALKCFVFASVGLLQMPVLCT